METKCNILMIGNSGAGKSTLVNAVFNSGNVATVGHFGGGMTQKLKIYYNEELNYSVIDTKGLELGFLAQQGTLNQVRGYIKDVIQEGDADAAIDVVWYCVDSQGKRFFKENVKQIEAVYKYFPNVPVIIVLTKAYCSESEREKNEQKAKETLEKYDKKGKIKLCDILSVNSAPFITANNDTIGPFGIKELINETNEILPEAKKTSEDNMNRGKKKLRRKQANLTVTTCTSAAVVVGFAPIPVADAPILTAIQTGMTRAITNIYEIESNTILTGICDATIVSGTSKTALSALKAIPGLNVAVAMLNGIVAGIVTIAIGEAAIILCEKFDAGELSDSDKESISKIMSEQGQKQLQNLLGQLQTALSKVDIDKLDVENLQKILTALIKKRNTKDIASE
jgi:uncharacterized protein (DUF697 family)/GTP-binding protein EngB required for normal cell division